MIKKLKVGTHNDEDHVEVGTITWDPSKVIPWNDPSEIYGFHANPALVEQLKFKFVMGDRGAVYEIQNAPNVLACGYGYWGFQVYIFKNFRLDVNYSRILRIPIPDFDTSNLVRDTREYIKYIIKKEITAGAVQPIDFYK